MSVSDVLIESVTDGLSSYEKIQNGRMQTKLQIIMALRLKIMMMMKITRLGNQRLGNQRHGKTKMWKPKMWKLKMWKLNMWKPKTWKPKTWNQRSRHGN